MVDELAAPAEGQAAPAPSVPSWMDGLSPELRAYNETKGFTDPASVLSGYQNLEKLRGVPESQLLKLPVDMATPGAMDAVYDRLGRPAADKYTNALGEGFDANVFKVAADAAHKAGLSDTQFKTMQETMATVSKGVLDAQESATAASFDTWKAANETGFQSAAKLMATVGMTDESLGALLTGDKAAMFDFLAKVAGRSQEGVIVHGEAPSDQFGLSPAMARSKIDQLYADKAFMDQYTSANARLRAPAIARMEALQIAAAKGV